MSGLDTELEVALKALEASFHVRLIGTFEPDLAWAPADVEAAPWLAKNYLDFDQFPVKQGDATVGILLREGDHGDKPVNESMQQLRDGLIVSADMPIVDLIPHLRANHYRLVLRGGRIDGLVTQSDMLKLPVRMLLFGLISHLELSLRALIRKRVPWPEWMELLGPKRRRVVNRQLADFKNVRFEPDPLEFTDFSDVQNALANQPDLADGFRAATDAIRELRNEIAHAKTYVSSADDMHQFVDRFGYVREWIDRVSRMLRAAELEAAGNA
jgi:hypothetical protein